MLTFVVAVGNYHRDIAERAIQSVLAQSVYCDVIAVYDGESMGPGYARNRGLEHVTSPFVSFLDSDDWVTPDFAEKMLLAYDGRHYIYSDWMADRYIQAPCNPWDGKGASHIVTTLLPTSFVRHVSGFDESTLSEDADFYWKLTRAGLCGKRLPEALFYYGKGGRRAQAFRDRPDRDQLSRAIVQRYEGMPMSCNGCGPGNSDLPSSPAGEPFEGAVLAQTLWAGNRQERGRQTGRLYPRSGNGKQLWVAPQDIDAAPSLFARVVEMPARVDEAELQAFKRLAGQLREAFGARAKDTAQEPAPAYAVPGEVKPDVGRVLRLYNPNMSLTEKEVNAVRHGAVLEVGDEGVKVNRPHAPDFISRTDQNVAGGAK